MYSAANLRNLLIATSITSSVALAINRHVLHEPDSLSLRAVCSGIEGNSDFYGLGIRLGIYLQWISSLLTNILIPDEVSDSLDTNSIFLFAVFIAIANATTSSEGLHPAEAFIMISMCFGYLFSVLSVSGLRIALLNDAYGLDPEQSIAKLRQFWNQPSVTSHHLFSQCSFDLESLQELFNPSSGQSHRGLPRSSFQDPPPGISIPRLQLLLLQALDFLATYSIIAVITPPAGAFDSVFHELAFPLIDLAVFLWLPSSSRQNVPINPAKAYRQERLLDYKEKRRFATGTLEPQLFSLGLTSVFKSGHVSWAGIFWRSCLVAGIGIYNVWFWFSGIEVLTADSCPTYIFLFYKANILGGVRTFFKVVSIVYISYSGILVIGCCYVANAFLGTTLRALLIHVFIMPYAKFVLFMGSMGSRAAKRRLEDFSATSNAFLRWFGIPTIRQLLSAFAYLSSISREAAVVNSNTHGEIGPMGTKAWATRLRILLILTTVSIVVWTIIAIELTLVFNSVSGVYNIESTGQLIPFIIGIFSLGKTLNLFSIGLIKKNFPNWSKITIGVNAQNRIVIKDLADTDAGLTLRNGALPHDIPLQDRVQGERQSEDAAGL
ncbi:hypothetical protein MMC18_008393 [Xylographa bjoerkii]|nr:hypothetical protein [Xylographa bjoerkii]